MSPYRIPVPIPSEAPGFRVTSWMRVYVILVHGGEAGGFFGYCPPPMWARDGRRWPLFRRKVRQWLGVALEHAQRDA